VLSVDKAQFFRDFIQSSEVQKIRHPLYGALLYSPLYLLSHMKLTNNTWDQEKMLKVCTKLLPDVVNNLSALQLLKALGNNKPTILVKTENLLWECLMEITTGKDVCYSAMKRFFSRVDWDAIAMVSEAKQAHFTDSELFEH